MFPLLRYMCYLKVSKYLTDSFKKIKKGIKPQVSVVRILAHVDSSCGEVFFSLFSFNININIFEKHF